MGINDPVHPRNFTRSRTLPHPNLVAEPSPLLQQFRQLGDVDSNAPRLVYSAGTSVLRNNLAAGIRAIGLRLASFRSLAMRRAHKETHLVKRIGWLRAAVLGANDGIISTASLILGVAAAAAAKSDILIAGAAGLVAGAMSMAAGEYVSVSSQSDTEQADLAREKRELIEDPDFEKAELARIYALRGVEIGLAREVARQLMAKDALGAHARDELGISEITTSRPVQAALTSAATFSAGAAAPLVLVMLSPSSLLIPVVSAGSLVALALLGFLGAKMGGADVLKPTVRVTFWGALAMAVTAGIGAILGTVV